MTIVSFLGRKSDISIAIFLLISALVANNLIQEFILKDRDPSFIKALASSFSWEIFLFVSVTIFLYGVGLYILLRFIQKVNEGKSNATTTNISLFRLMPKLIWKAQIVITVIIMLIVLEILLTSHYRLGLLISAMIIGYTFASIIMALLSYKFFSWHKSSHKNISLILYGLTFAVAAIGTGMIIVINGGTILLEQPAVIGMNGNGFSNNTIAFNLLATTYMPLRVAFVLCWAATAFLLHSYSKTIGKLKFWTIVSLPLISFVVAAILEVENTLDPLPLSPFLRQLILASSGILFAVAFFTTAKDVKKNHNDDTLAYYLTNCGYGIILLVISVCQPVVNVSYPPFVGVSWPFVALASYLFSYGFYYSAICIARDTKLRRLLRKLVADEHRLLHNIGTAEMEQELQGKVEEILKDHQDILNQQTLTAQSSLNEDDDDMKEYLHDVLREVKK